MSATANRIVKNTGFLYAKMGITMFLSLWTTRLILQALGASDFGLFNLVGGIIAMFGFVGASMSAATQRFMNYAEGEGNEGRKRHIFNVAMVLHVLVALAFGLLLAVVGHFLFHGFLTIEPARWQASRFVYGCLIASTMLTVVSAPCGAVLNAHENMRYYALVGILESLLKLSVAFAVLHASGDRLRLYGLLMALVPCATMAIMWGYCRRHYEECRLGVRRYWDSTLMRDLTSFAGWSFLGISSQIFSFWGIGVVLNHFFGAIVNAAYGIANQLTGQMLAFTTNMLKALNPAVAKSEGAGERQRMIRLASTGCKFSFALMAVFAVPALIEMPALLRLWLRQVPEWTVVFTRLQIVRILIEQATVVYGSAIAAEGNISGYNKLYSLINVGSIVLIYLLFEWGLPPVSMFAVYILLSGVVLSGVKLYFMKRNCGMPYLHFVRRVLVPVAVVFALSYAAGWGVHGLLAEGLPRLVAVFAVSMGVFVAGLYAVGLDADERRVAVAFMGKLKRKNQTNG